MRRIAPLVLVSALVLCTALAASAAPTFEPPVVLSNTPSNDVKGSDFSPVAATNGGTRRRYLCRRLIRQGRAGEPGFGHQDVLAATSTDGGATWSAPTPLNPVAAADGESNDLETTCRTF